MFGHPEKKRHKLSLKRKSKPSSTVSVAPKSPNPLPTLPMARPTTPSSQDSQETIIYTPLKNIVDVPSPNNKC